MSESTREERKKAIKKAIRLVGWIDISERITTKEDREIYRELYSEFETKMKAETDAKLKKHGISF